MKYSCERICDSYYKEAYNHSQKNKYKIKTTIMKYSVLSALIALTTLLLCHC
jgi:hypothetical protein